MNEPTLEDYQQAFRNTRTEESLAYETFRSGREGLDVPRFAFTRFFNTVGYDETLRLLSDTARPYAGVFVWDQPENAVDTWEQFITDNSKTGSFS